MPHAILLIVEDADKDDVLRKLREDDRITVEADRHFKSEHEFDIPAIYFP